MHDPMLGQIVDGFKIVEELGSGNMGSVYVALDIESDRKVAMKILNETSAADEGLRQRFLHEIKVEASLEHPNIATLLKAGKTELGQMYIIMPLYEGKTLERRIALGAIPIDEAVSYAAQIAQGLNYAHQQNIIHRDVKPANIFITSGGVVKILDFGVAKLGSNVLTKTGMIVGTMRYMAPEQIDGKPTHLKIDIWAWGLILFEMLTGKPVFSARGMKVMFAIMNEQPEKLAIYLPRSRARKNLQKILDKTLVKDPAERYDDFQQVLDDISPLIR